MRLVFDKYFNGRIRIDLVDSNNGEPIATVTVNIPEANIENDEVIIKDYGENEGMLDLLVSRGVVIPTGRSVKSGFVTMPICELKRRKDNV